MDDPQKNPGDLATLDVRALVRFHGTEAWNQSEAELAKALSQRLTVAFLGSASSGKDSAIRALFDRETVLASDWYQARLAETQQRRTDLWHRHIGYIEQFLSKPNYADEARRLVRSEARRLAEAQLTETAQNAG